MACAKSWRCPFQKHVAPSQSLKVTQWADAAAALGWSRDRSSLHKACQFYCLHLDLKKIQSLEISAQNQLHYPAAPWRTPSGAPELPYEIGWMELSTKANATRLRSSA